MDTILIIEDDPEQLRSLIEFFENRGFKVFGFTEPEIALNKKFLRKSHLCLVDLKLRNYDGISVLKKIREFNENLPVIIMTAFGSIESAVHALKIGAYDYITKPLDMAKLLNSVKNAIEAYKLKREIEILKEELKGYGKEFPLKMITKNPKMKEIIELCRKIASTNTNVLITGETGTGKEYLARFIHLISKRRGRFVPVNIASIPDTLIESELFGFEKGAFTGAQHTRIGKIEYADNGTLFLDEIGDLSLNLQTKILRVIEDKKIVRIGSNEEIEVDVRIIAATNKDLKKLVRDGSFREDLYWRLNVIHIELPPLRERKEDILPLAYYFMGKYSREMGKDVKDFADEAKEILLDYPWPGNIRELRNVIERAVALTEGKIISPKELFSNLNPEKRKGLKTLEEVEREYILKILEFSDYNLSKAAKILGIHRNTLRLKLKKHGLK